MNYKERVTAIILVLIQNMLGSFATNPYVNWKDKDSVIFLVVSLATKEVGGNYVLTNLVNVESFFGSIIVLELKSQNVNRFLMLRTNCIDWLDQINVTYSIDMAWQMSWAISVWVAYGFITQNSLL